MVLGFNHNVNYKGEVFHVQTEDSGIANPHIITLLYRGGVIISSKKTSYSDILKMESLETVVEELMKEQHKDMMRRLKSGEFDEKAFSIKAQLIENYQIQMLEPEIDKVEAAQGSPPASVKAAKGDISSLFAMPAEAAKKAETKAPDTLRPDKVDKVVNLDEVVLSFFNSHEKKS